jgi:hypothetical protein
MASPVFETMFFGSFNQKDDIITISDVQADAFKALLEYIYTDKININNVDKAFDLCYAAKKYMLPYVVDQCTKFLWSDLCPKNACRAYEFAKLFEEPSLQEKCEQIFCTKTMDVIADSSFEEVELSTLITILDQDSLNIDNELSLFFALNRYAEKHGYCHENSENQEQNQNEDESGDDQEPINVDAGPSNRPDPQPQQPQAHQQQQQQPQQVQRSPTIRDVIKKIRFLTLTPQQFAEGPARTNLLSQSEAFAILMNISTPNSVYPMPEGFSKNKNLRNSININNLIDDSLSPSPQIQYHSPIQPMQVAPALPAPIPGPSNEAHRSKIRKCNGKRVAVAVEYPRCFNVSPPSPRDFARFHEEHRYYCFRTIQQIREIFNHSIMDVSFTFSVDRNVSILGFAIFTQVRQDSGNERFPMDRYNEIIYAEMGDSLGIRLTEIHLNQRVPYDSDHEIFFDRPVFIQSNKMYKMNINFNKPGCYREFSVQSTFRSGPVTFTFNTGNPSDTIREGLIRGIIFSM